MFFFQAEDGIRDSSVTEFRRVLFRSRPEYPTTSAALDQQADPPLPPMALSCRPASFSDSLAPYWLGAPRSPFPTACGSSSISLPPDRYLPGLHALRLHLAYGDPDGGCPGCLQPALLSGFRAFPALALPIHSPRVLPARFVPPSGFLSLSTAYTRQHLGALLHAPSTRKVPTFRVFPSSRSLCHVSMTSALLSLTPVLWTARSTPRLCSSREVRWRAWPKPKLTPVPSWLFIPPRVFPISAAEAAKLPPPLGF